MIFQLYKVPGKVEFRVGSVIFTDFSIVRLEEYSKFWIGELDLEFPGPDVLRDLEFVKALEDAELQDCLILKILLKELELLGRFDIVEAVKSIKGA